MLLGSVLQSRYANRRSGRLSLSIQRMVFQTAEEEVRAEAEEHIKALARSWKPKSKPTKAKAEKPAAAEST